MLSTKAIKKNQKWSIDIVDLVLVREIQLIII